MHTLHSHNNCHRQQQSVVKKFYIRPIYWTKKKPEKYSDPKYKSKLSIYANSLGLAFWVLCDVCGSSHYIIDFLSI